MFTAQKVYQMLENEPLWQTALLCHERLSAANVPHAIAGGLAVCLHGYQRNTVDVDVLVRNDDAAKIRQALEGEAFRWDEKEKEFRTLAGIPVQFLMAGDRAGKGSEVHLPDPADHRAITELNGLPVLTLAKLIEAKIACGLGNLRRTHKDFADVVELIVHHRLTGTFARNLHKSVRSVYRELVRNSRGRP